MLQALFYVTKYQFHGFIMNFIFIFCLQFHERYKYEYWTKKLKPHIFYTAECALQCMLESHTNQAIIVSGESGSGKTESTKYMLRHLMHSSMEDKDSPLLKKIIQVSNIYFLINKTFEIF